MRVFARQHSCLRHRACYNTFAKPYFQRGCAVFNPPAETLVFMRLYFNIIVYTVPAALFYQTAQGWLAGIMQVRFSVAVGLTANIANALLAFILVYGCGLGVAVWLRLLPWLTSWQQFLRCTAFTKAGRVL